MNKIYKQPTFYLVFGIIIYVVVFFYLSYYKYQHFLYNLEDLSIFANTLFNTAHGHWLWFSTHGGYCYLGDHLELILIFLVPFYRLFPSVLTLLFFQTLLLGLSAWPLYLIAKKLFSSASHLSPLLQKWIPLIIAGLWLTNPYLQNINLEEFHLAPFLIFFFLWTFYFYLQKNYKLFWMFFILILFSREDASLTLGALALISAWENRRHLWTNKKWWLYPMLVSAIWFVLALLIIRHFSPGDNYKYLLLYGNIFSPLNWLIKIFSSKIIFLLIGLFLPFLFLPLLKPKYLFLALPTFLQIALLDAEATSVTLATHYQTFFLVSLFLSLILFFSQYNFKKGKNVWLILITLIGAQFFVSSYLGPLNFLTNHQNYLKNLESWSSNQEMLSLIPLQASVSAPYRLLPNLSNRQTAIVNRLTFLGKKHLSTEDFSLPENIDYILLDNADMIEYYLHFTNRHRFSSLYWNGADRLNQTISRLELYPVAQSDSLILYSKSGSKENTPFAILETTATPPNNFISQKKPLGEIILQGYSWSKDLAKISLFFSLNSPLSDDYFLRFSGLNSAEQKNWSKLYPPAYGLLPTHNWPLNKLIILNQTLPTSSNDQFLSLEIVKIKGDIELGPLNDTRLIIDQEQILGQVKLKINQ